MLQERRIDYSFDGLNYNKLHTIDIIWGSFIYRGLLMPNALILRGRVGNLRIPSKESFIPSQRFCRLVDKTDETFTSEHWYSDCVILGVKIKNMYSGIEISIFTDLPSQFRDHAKSRNQCVYLPRIAPSNYSLQTSLNKKVIQKKVE